MKPKTLFGLGTALLCIGFTWLLVGNNMHDNYSKLTFSILLLAALLSSIGGFIMIIASVDNT